MYSLYLELKLTLLKTNSNNNKEEGGNITVRYDQHGKNSVSSLAGSV